MTPGPRPGRHLNKGRGSLRVLTVGQLSEAPTLDLRESLSDLGVTSLQTLRDPLDFHFHCSNGPGLPAEFAFFLLFQGA